MRALARASHPMNSPSVVAHILGYSPCGLRPSQVEASTGSGTNSPAQPEHLTRPPPLVTSIPNIVPPADQRPWDIDDVIGEHVINGLACQQMALPPKTVIGNSLNVLAASALEYFVMPPPPAHPSPPTPNSWAIMHWDLGTLAPAQRGSVTRCE
jgi:hypothetical protein